MCNGKGQAWINDGGAYLVVRCECDTCQQNRTDYQAFEQRLNQRLKELPTEKYLEIKRKLQHA